MKTIKKKVQLSGLAALALILLSGCVASTTKNGIRVPKNTHSWEYNILVRPMASFVDLFAKHLNLGYGLAIIIVTLIVRFIILPLGLRQAYKSTYMQEKMAYLTPVFQPINDRIKAARAAGDNTAAMAAQQELMKAQKDNGINMLSSIGCLPLIIQWPFFMSLYYAAEFTPGIATATFFGINLGKPSVVLTLFAGVFYLLQSWISMFGMTPEQKKSSQLMLFLSPVMIIVFSFMSPAGVTLYWVAGGLVILIQQIIVSFIMKPHMKKRIDEEFKNNPPKMTDLPKDVTPAEAVNEGEISLIESDEPDNKPKKNRNAGKQNR